MDDIKLMNIVKEELYDRIRNHWLFSSFNKDFVDLLIERFVLKGLEPGETFFEEGDDSDTWCVLLQGKIGFYKEGELLADLGEGEPFGELGFLSKGPRTATCKARYTSVIAELHREDYELLLSKEPRLQEVVGMFEEFRVAVQADEARDEFRYHTDEVLELVPHDIEFLMKVNDAAGGEEQLRHSKEVGLLAYHMAQVLNPKIATTVALGGNLHEIGKISLPRQTLGKYHKKESLTSEEEDRCRLIFQNSAELVENIDKLKPVANIFREMDRDDYRTMSLEAQIIRLADDYLEMHESSRQNMPREQVYQELEKHVGTRYHRNVYQALLLKSTAFAVAQIDTLLQSSRALLDVLDLKDNYTYRHSLDVQEMSMRIGQRAGLSRIELRTLDVGAILHDIGKLYIDESILCAPRKLTDEEFEIIKLHPVYSEDFVEHFPGIEMLRKVVRGHHEKWDGSGYPDGLKGEEIPLLARIMTIADVWSALTTARVYRKDEHGNPHRFTPEKALSIMEETAEGHFDPELFQIFKSIVEEEFLGSVDK